MIELRMRADAGGIDWIIGILRNLLRPPPSSLLPPLSSDLQHSNYNVAVEMRKSGGSFHSPKNSSETAARWR